MQKQTNSLANKQQTYRISLYNVQLQSTGDIDKHTASYID